MPFALSGRARIHYTIHGDSGPVVVLLQGLGLSSRFWFDVPEVVARDPARPRRVLAIDNRGTGKSHRPRGVWTMGAMADDVAAVLDDVGARDAVVAGISMGGMIAQHVAIRHPARVRGLCLFATTPGFLYGAMPKRSAMLRLLSIPLGGKQAGRNLARLLLPESKWHRAREILSEWPNAMRDERTSGATFAAHLFAASTHMSAPHLGRIGCPVVVVTGDSDMLVPRRNAEVLVRRIPGAELEVVPDAGHAVFAEDRDLVRRMVARVEARYAGRS
jgi:pimeloyl-ACP methyl ester carboxylesterase